MTERVLLLASDHPVNEDISERLCDTGIKKTVWITDPLHLEIDAADLKKFDVIVISDTYCGNGRDTARLVRQIRKDFKGPMIALIEFATNEGPFACQVAGCNFVVGPADTAYSLCLLVPKICEELAREHQKDVAA